MRTDGKGVASAGRSEERKMFRAAVATRAREV
jgi:hypothetical protein